MEIEAELRIIKVRVEVEIPGEGYSFAHEAKSSGGSTMIFDLGYALYECITSIVEPDERLEVITELIQGILTEDEDKGMEITRDEERFLEDGKTLREVYRANREAVKERMSNLKSQI